MDSTVLASHTEYQLQQLINMIALDSREFGLTISIKKTNIMGQGMCMLPAICIYNTLLEAVENFTYLGSTISRNLSFIIKMDKHIAKVIVLMSRLCKRVWNNNQLTVNTKLKVPQACILSTLLCGTESWTTYTQIGEASSKLPSLLPVMYFRHNEAR